jgi:hypothetical protein
MAERSQLNAGRRMPPPAPVVDRVLAITLPAPHRLAYQRDAVGGAVNRARHGR